MLRTPTRPEWVAIACADIDRVLLDHAHCEKKAAASAMSLVAGYPQHPELVRRMTALAIEELQHFRAVHERLVERGIGLGRDPGDPYAQELFGLLRANQGRLTDRLLVFGLIEARSQERLELLSRHLVEPGLKELYRSLSLAEARHAGMFYQLACRYDEASAVEERLSELSRAESEIVSRLPLEPRIH